MTQATLCFVFGGNPRQRILLGYKKRGFGQGKYDGFGGKIQQGESVLQAALRELNEEAGLSAQPADLTPFGVIKFIFPYKPAWNHMVHIFVVGEWRGTPMESEEMRPEWFDLSEIPFTQMWDDSRYWLPDLLAGRKIEATFIMNEDNDTVKDYNIKAL